MSVHGTNSPLETHLILVCFRKLSGNAGALFSGYGVKAYCQQLTDCVCPRSKLLRQPKRPSASNCKYLSHAHKKGIGFEFYAVVAFVKPSM